MLEQKALRKPGSDLFFGLLALLDDWRNKVSFLVPLAKTLGTHSLPTLFVMLVRLFNLFFRVVLIVFFAFLFGINCFRNALDLLHFALVLFVLLPQLVQLHLLVRS